MKNQNSFLTSLYDIIGSIAIILVCISLVTLVLGIGLGIFMLAAWGVLFVAMELFGVALSYWGVVVGLLLVSWIAGVIGAQFKSDKK